MTSPKELLRGAMSEAEFSQSALARISGVPQPSISQFLAGKSKLSDEMLDRLLSCMGYRLDVTRSSVRPCMNRSESRSWLLHREIAGELNRESFERWQLLISQNMAQLQATLKGQPHTRNLEKWRRLIAQKDILGIRRALTGLDRNSIEMREVSPFAGVLSDQKREPLIRRAGDSSLPH